MNLEVFEESAQRTDENLRQLAATIWTPIGRFSGDVPARTTTHGLPERLYGIV